MPETCGRSGARAWSTRARAASVDGLRLAQLRLAGEAEPERLVEAEDARGRLRSDGRARDGVGGRRGNGSGTLCGGARGEEGQQGEGDGEYAVHSNLRASMGSSCEAFRAG